MVRQCCMQTKRVLRRHQLGMFAKMDILTIVVQGKCIYLLCQVIVTSRWLSLVQAQAKTSLQSNVYIAVAHSIFKRVINYLNVINLFSTLRLPGNEFHTVRSLGRYYLILLLHFLSSPHLLIQSSNRHK